eukprot:COSAG02_NODE_179_length_31090_cov_49.813785_26_plen_68_part_00
MLWQADPDVYLDQLPIYINPLLIYNHSNVDDKQRRCNLTKMLPKHSNTIPWIQISPATWCIDGDESS